MLRAVRSPSERRIAETGVTAGEIGEQGGVLLVELEMPEDVAERGVHALDAARLGRDHRHGVDAEDHRGVVRDVGAQLAGDPLEQLVRRRRGRAWPSRPLSTARCDPFPAFMGKPYLRPARRTSLIWGNAACPEPPRLGMASARARRHREWDNPNDAEGV